MNFEKELKQRQERIEGILLDFLPEEKDFQKTLCRAMNYSFRAGGKRIRPMLMQLSFELFGGADDAVNPFMAAMEMIHTSSLIHDDLPALDNDELRRGMPTSHRVYGEAMAILAGDGLMNYAYETAARVFEIRPGDAGAMKALRILAEKSGVHGMLGGQSVDVELDGKKLDAPTLDFIYRLKTGALIEGSLMVGAALANAGDAEIAVMEQIGAKVGKAFQIQDDILDVTGDQEKLGKPIGSDARNSKTTYVTLYGLEQAAGEVEALTRDALSLFDRLPGNHPFFRELLIWMTGRSK